MPIFVVVARSPLELPPRPIQWHTRSMIHEGMETQTLEGHGFVDNPPNDDMIISQLSSVISMQKNRNQRKSGCINSWLVFRCISMLLI